MSSLEQDSLRHSPNKILKKGIEHICSGEKSPFELQGENLGGKLAKLTSENERLRFRLRHAEDRYEVSKSMNDNLKSRLAHLESEKRKRGTPPPLEPKLEWQKPAKIKKDEQDLRSFQCLLAKKELEIQDTKTQLTYCIDGLKSKLEEEKDRNQAILLEKQHLAAQVSQTKVALESEREKRANLEVKNAELEREASSFSVANLKYGSNELYLLEVQELRQQVKKLQPLIVQNKILEEKLKDYQDLSLKLATAESKVRCLQELVESENAHHVEFLETKSEVAKWKSLIWNIDENIRTPEDLFSYIKGLEATNARRVNEQKTLHPFTEGTSKKLSQAICDSERLFDSDTNTSESIKNLEIFTKRAEELCYRLGALENCPLAEEKVPPTYIEVLEDTHKFFREILSTTSQSVESMMHETLVPSIPDKNMDLQAAQQSIESMRNRIIELENKLGYGEYNPQNTKVLHLKRNPHNECQMNHLKTHICKLEADNRALREMLGSLQDSALEQHKETVQADLSLKLVHKEGEIILLQSRLAEVQKGFDRLQQVFSRQISLLRESIPKIFGYNLEMMTDPSMRDCRALFTLYLTGSDHPSPKLSFRLMKDGSLQLMQTEFSRMFPQEITTFVDKFNSIPALTANLTLENFQKQTQV